MVHEGGDLTPNCNVNATAGNHRACAVGMGLWTRHGSWAAGYVLLGDCGVHCDEAVAQPHSDDWTEGETMIRHSRFMTEIKKEKEKEKKRLIMKLCKWPLHFRLHIFLAIYIYTRTFYQDRLGTNIGKTQKQTHIVYINSKPGGMAPAWASSTDRDAPYACTMRLLLIGQNRSIFIGTLGQFWICFDRIMANA